MTSDWSPCANCPHLGVEHAANGPCVTDLCECAEFEAVVS